MASVQFYLPMNPLPLRWRKFSVIMTAFLFHPLTTFIAGAALSAVALCAYLYNASVPNQTGAFVENYNNELARSESLATVNADEGVKRFSDFLQGIGSQDFIRENTAKVYADDAYLNDTLLTHKGPKEIEAYFLKTADTMTGFEVKIDSVFASGVDHFVRWTMIFSAPALAKGEPVHSIGISQVRFNSDGKVILHQDFWDSGSNFFAQVPISGVVIEKIRKRLD